MRREIQQRAHSAKKPVNAKFAMKLTGPRQSLLKGRSEGHVEEDDVVKRKRINGIAFALIYPICVGKRTYRA